MPEENAIPSDGAQQPELGRPSLIEKLAHGLNRHILSWRPAHPLVAVDASAPEQISVVRVRTHLAANGVAGTAHGSAFHVGKGVFISAGHNFIHHIHGQPSLKYQSGEISVGAWVAVQDYRLYQEYIDGPRNAFDVSVFWVAPGHAPSKSVELAAKQIRGDADVFGYPSGERGYDGSVLCHSVGPCFSPPRSAFINHSASTLTGTSGGPIMIDGLTVGVHTSEVTGPNGALQNQGVALSGNFINWVKSLR